MELTDFSFEKPLMRKRKKRDYSVIGLLLLLALIAALLVDAIYLTPSRLAGTAHASAPVHVTKAMVKHANFCAQALLDHMAAEQRIAPRLAEVCILN